MDISHERASFGRVEEQHAGGRGFPLAADLEPDRASLAALGENDRDFVARRQFASPSYVLEADEDPAASTFTLRASTQCESQVRHAGQNGGPREVPFEAATGV
jgi:hypothetical protein